jgi:alkylation response protein AidB-like acyl-CoA dehydrogenase
MEVTTEAVQLFGDAGYTQDFPVERMMRDAKDHPDLRRH